MRALVRFRLCLSRQALPKAWAFPLLPATRTETGKPVRRNQLGMAEIDSGVAVHQDLRSVSFGHIFFPDSVESSHE